MISCRPAGSWRKCRFNLFSVVTGLTARVEKARKPSEKEKEDSSWDLKSPQRPTWRGSVCFFMLWWRVCVSGLRSLTLINPAKSGALDERWLLAFHSAFDSSRCWCAFIYRQVAFHWEDKNDERLNERKKSRHNVFRGIIKGTTKERARVALFLSFSLSRVSFHRCEHRASHAELKYVLKGWKGVRRILNREVSSSESDCDFPRTNFPSAGNTRRVGMFQEPDGKSVKSKRTSQMLRIPLAMECRAWENASIVR